MININRVTKTFRIPHEKRDTFRERLFGLFNPPKYEKFYSLKDVSLTVDEGDWLGIVGSNGSGKSTLLKVIAGIYLPDSGRVIFEGKMVPFLELGVGFNPELSARDNIFLNAVMLGMTRREAKIKFKTIVEFAEIENFLDTKLKNFSSGMQVRLGFSIASQIDADIYLFDEVLAVGDVGFQKKCEGVFSRLKTEKKTVLFVSHNLASIEKWCKKTAWVKNGKLKLVGKSKEVVFKYWYSTLTKEEKNVLAEKKRRKKR